MPMPATLRLTPFLTHFPNPLLINTPSFASTHCQQGVPKDVEMCTVWLGHPYSTETPIGKWSMNWKTWAHHICLKGQSNSPLQQNFTYTSQVKLRYNMYVHNVLRNNPYICFLHLSWFFHYTDEEFLSFLHLFESYMLSTVRIFI